MPEVVSQPCDCETYPITHPCLGSLGFGGHRGSTSTRFKEYANNPLLESKKPYGFSRKRGEESNLKTVRQGDREMNSRIWRFLTGVFWATTMLTGSASTAEISKIAVLNPRGVAPPIRLVPMAPRLDSLDGKTIYIINIGFGDTFLPEMQKVLSERYPKTTWVFKRKAGSYFDDDPKLWTEIKEKGNGMIMGVGH
jgi:hypothetical protein